MIYKIIVDKQPMSNPSEERKEYEIDIDQLYFKHDVYDSLVITHDEDYVMRRLALQDYNVLVELDPPIKEPLENINIELFEGENYIYLYDMTGNKIVAQYLVKNEFNELYVLETEMHTAIRQSANEIELIVGGQVTTLDGAVQDINGELSLKVDKNDNDQIVSMINASADEIYLTSNRLVIDSTNFKLSDAGNITATGGTVGGFTLGQNQFSANLTSDKMSRYTYTQTDLTRISNIIMGTITPTSQDYDKYDFDNSGEIRTRDYTIVQNIVQGREDGKAVYTLNTKNSENAITIADDDGNTRVNLGLFGSYINYLSVANLFANSSIRTNTGYFVENPNVGSFYLTLQKGDLNGVNGGMLDLYNNQGAETISLFGQNGHIDCVSITPSSVAEKKKNFEKLQSGLDIIKNIDIYKYNMNFEHDDTKKHIGFVIGDKFKYSKEITSENNDGADLYSFVSVCCKAIQEQQEEIQELKARIEKLEKGDK